MLIELVSDLHHEFYEDLHLYKNPNNVQVLVIAGDLAVGSTNVHIALKRFKESYEHVVYVPGNHEYYGSTIRDFDDSISDFTRNSGIHFLNPGTIKIEDTTFVGAALWTNFQEDHFARLAAKDRISDFYNIKDFSTTNCVELNTIHKQYIKQMLQLSNRVVVVTHFLPTLSCISQRFRGAGLLNKYFANDLEDLVEEYQPLAWLFGHTHDQINYQHAATQVIANPYGYNQNKGYSKCLISV